MMALIKYREPNTATCYVSTEDIVHIRLYTRAASIIYSGGHEIGVPRRVGNQIVKHLDNGRNVLLVQEDDA